MLLTCFKSTLSIHTYQLVKLLVLLEKSQTVRPNACISKFWLILWQPATANSRWLDIQNPKRWTKVNGIFAQQNEILLTILPFSSIILWHFSIKLALGVWYGNGKFGINKKIVVERIWWSSTTVFSNSPSYCLQSLINYLYVNRETFLLISFFSINFFLTIVSLWTILIASNNKFKSLIRSYESILTYKLRIWGLNVDLATSLQHN